MEDHKTSFEIFKQTGEGYQFLLKAHSGKTLLEGNVYNKKEHAIQDIDMVKKNAAKSDRYERKTSKDGFFFFHLKTPDGKIIASSEKYASESGMENGINSIKRYAPFSNLKEFLQ